MTLLSFVRNVYIQLYTYSVYFKIPLLGAELLLFNKLLDKYT